MHFLLQRHYGTNTGHPDLKKLNHRTSLVTEVATFTQNHMMVWIARDCWVHLPLKWAARPSFAAALRPKKADISSKATHKQGRAFGRSLVVLLAWTCRDLHACSRGWCVGMRYELSFRHEFSERYVLTQKNIVAYLVYGHTHIYKSIEVM